ncbi:MAG: DUF2290 domain-containing protein [Clostridia bacterium]|nr:DUF2290 domain-containing protein [Clostridia bacterium]
MNRSKYLTNIEECYNLLKSFSILSDKTFHYKQTNDRKFSVEFYQNIHCDCNITKYRSILKNYDYDFILKDNSIFSFSVLFSDNKVSKISMYYYQNPYSFPSVEDYDKYKENPEYFEQKCDEAELTNNWTIIRYDYSESEEDYKELIHYPAHLHIGNNNEIRLPFNMLITPLSFINFVVMQVYPNIWTKYYQSHSDLINLRNYDEDILLNFISANDDRIYKIK